MSTAAEKLNLLLNTKADIKAALVEKGQDAGDVFSTYADKIRAIETCPDDALFVNSVSKTAAMSSKSYWNYATYGGGKFVTVAYNTNKAAYSVDGIKWIAATLPCTANWTSVTYGNGLYVAVASDTNVVAYSTDCITWHEATMPTPSYWYSVCYGDGKFVAVSKGTANVAYSTDGINWTDATLPVAKNWLFVMYAAGKFVAVGDGADGCAYSTDGINWTGTTMPASSTWQSVVYGNGLFVATSSNASAAYSVDGIHWNAATMPVAKTWKAVTYGKGKFVSVAFGSNAAAYSTDGIRWEATTMPESVNWQSVAYGNGVFAAITYNNSKAAVSYDGVTWSKTVEVSTIVDVNELNVTEATVVEVVHTQGAMTIRPGLSEQIVVDAGMYTTGAVKVAAMPIAEQATPSVSVDSSGKITATATQEAGYVAAGTKTGTEQLTAQAAKTVTPSTSAQTAVAAGVYTTGAVVVAGDANLKAENIAEGVSIFGVVGSHSGGGKTVKVTYSTECDKYYLDANGNPKKKTSGTGGTDDVLDGVFFVYGFGNGATYSCTGEHSVIAHNTSKRFLLVKFHTDGSLTFTGGSGGSGA